MQDRVLGDYGGPFEDALPIEDPETQLSADQYNRLAEDTAQLTRTGTRAIVRFSTTTGAEPMVQSACSIWGNGDAQRPALKRAAAGHYMITYPPSFVDELGQEEEVFFSYCFPQIEGAAPGHARLLSVEGSMIKMAVFDATWSASDLGGGVIVTLWLR